MIWSPCSNDIAVVGAVRCFSTGRDRQAPRGCGRGRRIRYRPSCGWPAPHWLAVRRLKCQDEGEDYDLAGFCVGVVERANIIDGTAVNSGDTLIALASSGPHSNGYSLIRKVLEVTGADTQQSCGDVSLGEALLAPTTIYNRPLLDLQQSVSIKAMAHITGGGILENLPRVLPDGVGAIVQRDTWALPPVFQWLQSGGNIEDTEMLRTFNCGVGMILVTSPTEAPMALEKLQEWHIDAWQIGEISEGARGVQLC